MSELLQLDSGKVELTPLGATFSPDISEAKFKETWKKIRTIYAATGWIVGDAINFATEKDEEGNYVRKWGSKYAKALNETDWEYGTLRNFAYVCNAVPLSRRRDNLPFGHHVEIAPLPPKEQEKWLEKAEAEVWSRSDLRIAIRKANAVHTNEENVSAGYILKREVNRMMRWLTEQNFEDEERKENIKRTLAPLVGFYNGL